MMLKDGGGASQGWCLRKVQPCLSAFSRGGAVDRFGSVGESAASPHPWCFVRVIQESKVAVNKFIPCRAFWYDEMITTVECMILGFFGLGKSNYYCDCP